MPEPYRDPPPAEGGDDLVAVASHFSSVEAEMERGYLVEHGIRAVVNDSASFNPLVNVAAGGARVLVRSADESRARSLLRRLARTPANEDDEDDGEVRCPRCELAYCFHENALSGTARTSGLALSPLLAILALPLGLSRKRWRCHKCLHVWDDPHEGPAKRTPLHPDDPRPVFRLRRRRSGTGLFVGLLLVILPLALVRGPGVPEGVRILILALGLLLPILGYVIGRRSTTDVCSSPGCRADLRPGVEECPMCRGAVVDVIHGAHEHFSESADVRRELAAVRAEAEQRPLARTKKPAKKGPRVAAPPEPPPARTKKPTKKGPRVAAPPEAGGDDADAEDVA